MHRAACILCLALAHPAAASQSHVADVDADADAGADAGADLVIILGDDPEPAAPAAGTSTTRVVGEISSHLLLDRRQERVSEDVLEWWNRARGQLNAAVSDTLSIVGDAWLRWGVTGEAPGAGHPNLLLNTRKHAWERDVQLREAYARWRRGAFDLTAGQRLFTWGKNEVLAAADVLNPIDVRFDPTAALHSPNNAKAPVVALDATWHHDASFVTAVVLPFFHGHRATLAGGDFALAAPGSPLTPLLGGSVAQVTALEAELQEALLHRETPNAAPSHASAALRAGTTVGSWDLAATAYYGWERIPEVTWDPDAALLLAAGADITADPDLLFNEPSLRDAALAVQQKVAVGQPLARAQYNRLLVCAIEGAGSVGDLVVRFDAGYSPRRVYYDTQLLVTRSDTLSAALGLEYTYGDSFYAAVTGYATGILSTPRAPLLFLERPEQPNRSTALFGGVWATTRYTWVDQRLTLGATGNYAVSPGDHVVIADLRYANFEPHELGFGLLILNGPRGTLGGLYQRNDFFFLSYKGTW